VSKDFGNEPLTLQKWLYELYFIQTNSSSVFNLFPKISVCYDIRELTSHWNKKLRIC